MALDTACKDTAEGTAEDTALDTSETTRPCVGAVLETVSGGGEAGVSDDGGGGVVDGGAEEGGLDDGVDEDGVDEDGVEDAGTEEFLSGAAKTVATEKDSMIAIVTQNVVILLKFMRETSIWQYAAFKLMDFYTFYHL